MKTIRIATLALITSAMGSGCGDDDATTTGPARSYVQVDRMAVPALNTALIPSSQKESFNRSSPVNDVANYRTTVQNMITGLRSAVAPVLGPEDASGISASDLTDVIIPDVVTVNFAQPVQFPNGRRPQDDVIDAVLGLVLNRGNVLGGGPGVSDAVGPNDVAFLSTFPYLAPPQALPKPSL